MTEVGDTDFGLQVGIGVFGKIATAVIGLVGSVIVARVVGPSGYGVFYISMAITQLCENTVTGWATASKKRMTETGFDDGEALGSVLLAIGAVILLGGPLSYLILEAVTANPIIPIAVPVLFSTISSYWALNKLLSGRVNFSMSVWSGTVNTFVQIVVKVVLVVAGFGVWGMVGGTVAGPVFVLPFVFYWLDIRPAVPSIETIRSTARYARWSIPTGFFATALSRMDTLLLGWLATASVAGKYQVGLQLTMPAVFISGVIGSGLMGRVSNLASRDREWEGDLWNSLAYGSLLAVPIFCGGLVIGESLAVTVFGTEYGGAAVFVVGIALYRLIKTQTSPFRSVLKGLDRPELEFRVSLFSFVLNVSLGIALWTQFGAVGIVAATVITALVTYLLSLSYVRRIVDLRFALTEPFLKQLLSGAIMAAVVYGWKQTVGVSAWVEVVVVLAVGGTVYCSLVFLISPHLRATFRAIWNDFHANAAG